MSDKEKKEVITEEIVIEQTDEGVAVEEVIEKSEYADFDDLRRRNSNRKTAIKKRKRINFYLPTKTPCSK